jgi:isoleucyl-tRNA synthetase
MRAGGVCLLARLFVCVSVCFQIRRLAAEFASEAIARQRVDVQRWGVMADWTAPLGAYHTFDKARSAVVRIADRP